MTTETTEFRTIPGFGRYEISAKGEIRHRVLRRIRTAKTGNGSVRMNLRDDVGLQATLHVAALVKNIWGVILPKPPSEKRPRSLVRKPRHRNKGGPAIALSEGPDSWGAIARSAGKRDAIMAAAGRFEDVPDWLLEKELRCLRRAPSRQPTHVPYSSSASWAA